MLVVDDEPNIVDVVSMALRFQGFAVESAGTARDALAAVRSFDPHLMVLDIMLPDMEGFEVAERLGAQSPRSACRAAARRRSLEVDDLLERLEHAVVHVRRRGDESSR